MKEKEKLSGSGKKQFISLGVIAVLVLLTFYTLHRQVDNLNFRYLWGVFSKLNMGYIALAFGALVLFVIIEGQCLAALARALGYHPTLRQASVYASADLYFSAITPSATGGQPASAYYMVKDGMKVSEATTILVLNILQYTLSLILMGLAAFLIKFDFFMETNTVFKVLFYIGLFLQLLLLSVCLLCMFAKELIRKLGGLAVLGLYKIKLIKNKEGKMEKINGYIDTYQASVDFIKKKPGLMLGVLGGNVLQRVAFFTIAYCVYRSFGFHTIGYFDMMGIQILLAVAVNSLPIPGAIGVSEGSFLVLFQTIYAGTALTPAMVFTRGINYYLCFILCGIFTLIYHISVVSGRGKKEES